MIITVTQSGGFAGGTRSLGSIDTRKLASGAAAVIRSQVAALRRLAAERAEPVGADLLTYEIDIIDDGGKREAVALTVEDEVPPPLQALLEVLTA